MIDEVSRYAAACLAKRDGETEDRTKIYQIGVDVVLSTIFTIVGIGVLAALFKNLAGAALFLACFITVRSYSGGYHAATRTRCFFLTCGAYAVTLWASGVLSDMLHGTSLFLVTGLMAAAELAVFVVFVPVENKHKRLPPDWKRRNRKKAWFGLLGWKAAAIIFYQVSPVLSLQILVTEAVITILILWCRPWKEDL